MSAPPAVAPRPLLIGESNPYGADPEFALFPRPQGCAGERLCRMVFGLHEETYFAAFDRVNLLEGGAWLARRARLAARERCDRFPLGQVAVLCGVKVATAFRAADPALALIPATAMISPGRHQANGWTAIVLPHPSGLCRRWHEPGIIARCREVLREVLLGVPFGEADAARRPPAASAAREEC